MFGVIKKGEGPPWPRILDKLANRITVTYMQNEKQPVNNDSANDQLVMPDVNEPAPSKQTTEEWIQEYRRKEQARIDAMPWQDRCTRHNLYKGSMTETIIETINDDAIITRSYNGYQVLNTPIMGIVDIDTNVEYEREPQIGRAHV